MSAAPAVGNDAARRRPPRKPAIADSAVSAASMRERIASVCAIRVCPAAVSVTPRGRRSSNFIPVSASSAEICCETADCE